MARHTAELHEPYALLTTVEGVTDVVVDTNQAEKHNLADIVDIIYCEIPPKITKTRIKTIKKIDQKLYYRGKAAERYGDKRSDTSLH